MHVSRRSPHEAVLELGHGPDAALGRLVRVSGRRALNRAMEGDTVAGGTWGGGWWVGGEMGGAGYAEGAQPGHVGDTVAGGGGGGG